MQAAHRFSFSKRRALQIACLAATLFSGQAGFALPEPEPVSALVANGKDQVEVWSQGTGRLLVMLPSAARGADDYDAAAVVLAAQGFRVLRPEPRGSGRTTGPHIGVSLQDLASDVAAVIRSENSGPAILVGHAAGSFVARMTAVEYPGLVSGVVLAAAGARNYPIELNAVVQKVGLPGLPDEVRIRYLKQGFFAPGNDVTPWLTGWRKLIKFGTGGGPPSVAERELWWGAGNKPVLEIQGLSDPFKPPPTLGEYKAEYGERVTVVQIRNASHALFPEQLQAVTSAIAQWSKSIFTKESKGDR